MTYLPQEVDKYEKTLYGSGFVRLCNASQSKNSQML